ncbi:hypothetical protein PXK56_18435 [Phaeobacter gallaeciensis]|uniref:hypothetical protein n=1 Tax=Phaeobacter gallaeciensis TaxID=60890 RepID=UPI00237FFDF7|nr:hypothetical protein [Phaeobacter gallaeciensis]MDE4297166.1 hypothetical protein [Phaeobacter gallaeciensis]
MSSDESNELDHIAKEIIMTATQTNNGNMSSAQEAEVNAALAELDLESIEALETVTGIDELEMAGEGVVQEPEDEPEGEPETAEAANADAIVSEDELDELEMEVDKAEAYASQESAAVGASADGSIKKEGTTTPKKSGAPRASTPRTPRDMASVPAEHFVLTGDATAMSDEDKSASKAAVMAATPGQKKVAEKFENVFQSMAAGRAPSKYTMTAFAALDASGTATSAEIIAAFKTSGVGEGTARSQCGQMMALFPVLGVAERDGKSLKLKADSNIAAYLRKHIAA